MLDALKSFIKLLEGYLPSKVSATLLIGVAGLGVAAEGVGLFQGSEFREALSDRKFLLLATVVSLFCLLISIKYIKNGVRTKTIIVLAALLLIVTVASGYSLYSRRNLVYNSVGYYRDSTWKVMKQTDEALILQLEVQATKGEPTTLIFEFDLADNCPATTMEAMYPTSVDNYKFYATEEGERLNPRHRQWRIEKFQRPARIVFQLVLRHPTSEGALCVTDHVMRGRTLHGQVFKLLFFRDFCGRCYNELVGFFSRKATEYQ